MSKVIYYLYTKEYSSWVKQFMDTPRSTTIHYQAFSDEDVFPALDYDSIAHIVVSGSLAEIKIVIKVAREYNISLGIVPLPTQNRIVKMLDLPKDPHQAIELALKPSKKKIDLLYCNDILVLNDIRIGDASLIKEYEFHYAKYSFIKRLKLFASTLRKKSLLEHNKFTITTNKEKEIKLSCVGMIGLGYHNHSWISRLLKKHLSAIDGQSLLLVLAPKSLWQYFVLSPLKLFFGKNEEKIPSSCGYIKSSTINIQSEVASKVVIDDTKTIQTPITLQTQEKALSLSVGENFWNNQLSNKSDRNNIKLDNIPRDEEQMKYLQKGLPLVAHASKEQYSTLFSMLRKESTLSITFVTLLVLATIIATLGLFINSSSVIIGAMILAPLMQPIVSLSMGVLRQDKSLIYNGSKTIAIGIAISLIVAMSIAYLTPIHQKSIEMMARLSPTILDMLVAIASGVAAAYAKNDESITASLAGVAIAVALIPPLAVSGIGIGWGNMAMFTNAFLLFSTNLIGIVMAGAMTFFLLGYAPIVVAKRGIILWLVATVLITLPLYQSFDVMKKNIELKKTLTQHRFTLNNQNIQLKQIEYQMHHNSIQLRCEIILDYKLSKAQKEELHQKISILAGKPTEIIATFRYRL